MKFLWLLLVVALSALLFIQTANADAQAVKEIQNLEKDDKIIENKLLNEVETKNDMASDDEEESNDDDEEPTNSEVVLDNENLNKEVQDSQPELIKEEQVAAFASQPELYRLARNVKAFHNHNVLSGNNLQLEDDIEYDTDPLAEERAIRKRQRTRRRKTKNKVKRTNRNKHVANTRRSTKRRSQNKNSVYRKSQAKKSKAKRQNRFIAKRNNIRGHKKLKRKGLTRNMKSKLHKKNKNARNRS